MNHTKMSVPGTLHNSDINSDDCKNCLLYGCEDTNPAIFYECMRGVEDHYIGPKFLSTPRELLDYMSGRLSEYKENVPFVKADWSGFDDFLDANHKGFTPKEYAVEHEMRII